MVSVTSRNGPIRNSVLPNHLSDLANTIGLESRWEREISIVGLHLECLWAIDFSFFSTISSSRYYLKERAFHGTLVQDEEAEVRWRWDSIVTVFTILLLLISCVAHIQREQTMGTDCQPLTETSCWRTHQTGLWIKLYTHYHANSSHSPPPSGFWGLLQHWR